MSHVPLQSQFRAAMPLASHHWAHDIRNVLATIAIRLNTLESLSGPAGAHAADSIHDLISRVQSLCDDVVLYSGASNKSYKRQTVELASAIEHVAGIVLPTASSGFRIEISGSTRLAAFVDPTDLFRILFNLFQNAITVAHESGSLRSIRVHVGEIGGRIVIDVCDDGPGLPARVKAQLFRARPKRDGLKLRGFGLAIARELAERNGGSLKLLENTTGAHFRLRLAKAAFEAAETSVGAEVTFRPAQTN